MNLEKEKRGEGEKERAIIRKAGPRRVEAIKVAKLPQCLMWLGFRRKDSYRLHAAQYEKRQTLDRRTFWDQKPDKLMAIYEQARKYYLRAAKRAHPDNGGSHNKAVVVNLIWERIRYLYSQRGLLLFPLSPFLLCSFSPLPLCSQTITLTATNTITFGQAKKYSSLEDWNYVTLQRATYRVTNTWKPFQVAPGLTNWRITDTTGPTWLWTNTVVVGREATNYPPLPK